ncbi:ATPase [Candidatus Magnetomorum sp. HK-1]|nr:ATPase [Candidatus Magnetomorum sp. HK-1]
MLQEFSLKHFRQAFSQKKGYILIVANQHFSKILLEAIKYQSPGNQSFIPKQIKEIAIADKYNVDKPVFIISSAYIRHQTLAEIKKEQKSLQLFIDRLQILPEKEKTRKSISDVFKNIYIFLSIEYPQLIRSLSFFPDLIIDRSPEGGLQKSIIPYDDQLNNEPIIINFKMLDIHDVMKDYFYYFVPLLYPSTIYKEIIVLESLKKNVFKVKVVLHAHGTRGHNKGHSQLEVVKFDAISRINREKSAFDRINTNKFSDIIYQVRNTALFKGEFVAAIRSSAASIFTDEKQQKLREVLAEPSVSQQAKEKAIDHIFDSLKRFYATQDIHEINNALHLYQETILPYAFYIKLKDFDITPVDDTCELSRITNNISICEDMSSICCKLIGIIPDLSKANRCKLLFIVESDDDDSGKLLKLVCLYEDENWRENFNKKGLKIDQKVIIHNIEKRGWLFEAYKQYRYIKDKGILPTKDSSISKTRMINDTISEQTFSDLINKDSSIELPDSKDMAFLNEKTEFNDFQEICRTEDLLISGQKDTYHIPNPLHMIYQAIKKQDIFQKDYSGVSHGDLNIDNVIVHFGDTHSHKETRIHLIDLSEYNENFPLAFDAVTLETGIKLHILSTSSEQYQTIHQFIDALISFERQLYEDFSGKTEDDSTWSDDMKTFFPIIQKIRKMAFDRYPMSTVKAYKCYTQQLLFYSLRALSYTDLTSRSKAWAFITAGIAGEYLLQKERKIKPIKPSTLQVNPSENIYIDKEKNTPLPYAIKQIHMSQFYDTINTSVKELPVDAQWIFLTGENAFGKTLVLRAIALGLWGNINSNVQKQWFLTQHSKIGLEYKKGYSSIINIYGDKYFSPIQKLVAYGPSRLIIQDIQSKNKIDQESGHLYNLFHDDGILLNMELELIKWHGNNKKYGIVKDVLLRVMPYISDIQVINGQVVFFSKDKDTNNPGDGILFEQLASGPKSIFAMVGDMMIRMYQLLPDIIDPTDFYGFVIIDEIDVHLHLKWQKELPSVLSNVFPNIQFIVSTHSGIPMQGVNTDRSIFLKVNRDEENGIQIERLFQDQVKDMKHWTPNILLSSPMFDYEDYINKEITDLTLLKTEDSYKEMKEDEALDQFLNRFETKLSESNKKE